MNRGGRRKLNGSVDEIYLHEISTLRGTFPSHDVENFTANTFKDRDDNDKPSLSTAAAGGAPQSQPEGARARTLSTAGTTEAVRYNKVIGQEDYVLVDIVRKARKKKPDNADKADKTNNTEAQGNKQVRF